MKRSFYILGAIIALMPFMGFPGAWKDMFFIVAGILVAGFAFLDGREKILFRDKKQVSGEESSPVSPGETTSLPVHQ